LRTRAAAAGGGFRHCGHRRGVTASGQDFFAQAKPVDAASCTGPSRTASLKLLDAVPPRRAPSAPPSPPASAPPAPHAARAPEASNCLSQGRGPYSSLSSRWPLAAAPGDRPSRQVGHDVCLLAISFAREPGL